MICNFAYLQYTLVNVCIEFDLKCVFDNIEKNDIDKAGGVMIDLQNLF